MTEEESIEKRVRIAAYLLFLELDAQSQNGFEVTFRWDFNHDTHPRIRDFKIVRRDAD